MGNYLLSYPQQLRDVSEMVRKDGDDVVKDYLKYNEWVCRQVYMTPEEQVHSDLIECENSGLNLNKDTHFISTPKICVAQGQGYTFDCQPFVFT